MSKLLRFCCSAYIVLPKNDPSCSKISIWIIRRFAWLKGLQDVAFAPKLHFGLWALWTFLIQSETPNILKWKWTLSYIYYILLFSLNNYKHLSKTRWHFVLLQRSPIKAIHRLLFLPPAIIQHGSTGLLIPLHALLPDFFLERGTCGLKES